MSILIEEAKQIVANMNNKLEETIQLEHTLANTLNKIEPILEQLEVIHQKKAEELQLLEQLATLLNQIPKEN